MALRIDILTLFPEMFPPVLGASILGRAAAAGVAEFHVHDIRAHAGNRHRKVDDRPFGGGPGMVLMCQPLHDAVLAAERLDERLAQRILLTPQGERLEQRCVERLAELPRLLLIAGHYEGVDERVIDELKPLELSVGDYVLSGGEIPAMLLADAVVRLQPGALGHELSAAQDSFARREPPAPAEARGADRSTAARSPGPEADRGLRLLDAPHYTRPREWRGRGVPDVLLGGDHAAIEAWRRAQMLERTRLRRPDLL
ncbi:MAG TPA: tRNA (guanosine(37)-N1)-methyltransferase TrmD [Phycisphaerales bacterium]|nr:tRNA (guanosine(37)-N1)-methyltransferase TrmD [Phycisphaerales bacterium]HMP38730.1 tRNA (guanosine(37)-N1)-methyltransferase TrmD [Phycisphaerales bacterium]